MNSLTKYENYFHFQEEMTQISDVRLMVTRLYESLNVQEHQLLVERQLLGQLEAIKTELAPMEEVRFHFSNPFTS